MESLAFFIINPGPPGAGSGCHFRISSLILKDTEMVAKNVFFFKNSGQRFLRDSFIKSTNNTKVRHAIKINLRHKFSHFWEPWTLKSYCENYRIVSDTICFWKNAGNVFWFNASFEEAISCEMLSKFIKIKGTNFYLSIFLDKCSRLDFFDMKFISCIQNMPFLWEYGSSKHICQKIHRHFEFLCLSATRR